MNLLTQLSGVWGLLCWHLYHYDVPVAFCVTAIIPVIIWIELCDLPWKSQKESGSLPEIDQLLVGNQSIIASMFTAAFWTARRRLKTTSYFPFIIMLKNIQKRLYFKSVFSFHFCSNLLADILEIKLFPELYCIVLGTIKCVIL